MRFSMSKRGMWTAVVVLLALAAIAQEEKPAIWSLRVPAKARIVHPGQVFELEAVVELQPGWHVYAITQGPGGPVVTRFTVPPKQPFQLAGAVRQPTPKKAFDQNFGIPTEFFEERAAFTIPLKALPAAPGKYKVVANVEYQVCNDQLCMPPETLPLDAAITVTEAKAPETTPKGSH